MARASAKFTVYDESPLAREARHLTAKEFENSTVTTIVQYLRDTVYWEKELHELLVSGHTCTSLIVPRIKLPGYAIAGTLKNGFFMLIRSPDKQEFCTETWGDLGERVKNLLNDNMPDSVAGKLCISDGLVCLQGGALTRAIYAQPHIGLERLS